MSFIDAHPTCIREGCTQSLTQSQGSHRMCFDCNTAVKCIWTSVVQEGFGGFNMLDKKDKSTRNTYAAQPAFENYVVSHKKY